MSDDRTAEEEEILDDLAQGAGRIAAPLLAERNIAYLDDLSTESARELLREAWRAAATERLAGMDTAELHQEIDLMIDSLMMDAPGSGLVRPRLH